MIFGGLATTWNDAVKLIMQGGVEFSSNHDHDAVGPMAGVISTSLPILVVKGQSNSKTSFARFVENRVQFGLFDKESVDVLGFWCERLSPSLGKAIRQSNGIDLKPIMARACTWETNCIIGQQWYVTVRKCQKRLMEFSLVR
jgi:hypothetical protein